MLLRELLEASKTAVFAFGRMNPPTIGHKKLVDAVAAQAGDPYIFLSQSQKPKTDPLDFSTKLKLAQAFFPNVTVGDTNVRTIIQALQKIESMGYDSIIYVAGSDRIEDFKTLITKYNGTEYNFKNIEVVSAGERDPDADGAEGMSASKMRAAAAEGNFEAFAQGAPDKKLAKTMYDAVRNGMGVKDAVSAEGWSQKYKSSINCSHPKGFSQKAHCAGKKKHTESVETEMTCPDCGMCKTHGSLNEIAKGAKDSNGVTKCWPGKHAEGTKKGKNGRQVRNCVPNESVAEAANAAQQAAIAIAKKKKKAMDEAAKHGLYYNVNKRKKAGTSRDADNPKAPTAQAWRDAAKTAKKEGVAEGAPELLKKEMPLHRHAEKLLAQNGVSKDDPDYHHHLGNTIKHLRQFGNIDLINKQGVAEGNLKELSTDKLAQYKKAAGADAKKADAGGNYARGDKRFKGINKATNKQFDNDLKKHGQKGVAEMRDSRDSYQRDYDSSQTGFSRGHDHRGLGQELAHEKNNIAISINGKTWKVVPGKGTADSQSEKQYLNNMKAWAEKKSAATGKKWSVSLTGAEPTA